MIRKAFLGEATIGHIKPEQCNPEELITDFLPRRGVGVLVGDPAAGKSLLALHVASCLATGKRFVMPNPENIEDEDFARICELGSTLYLAGEGYDQIHLRIEAATNLTIDENQSKNLETLGNQLPIITLPVENLKWDNVYFVKDRIKECAKFLSDKGFPLKLIIFDTLSATCNMADENSNSHMQDTLGWIKGLAKDLDCFVILITHPPRGRAKKGSTRGASSLEGSADVVWHLRKVAKATTRKLTVTKRRDGVSESKVYTFDVISIGRSAAIIPTDTNDVAPVQKEREAKPKKIISPNDEQVLEAVKNAVRVRLGNNDFYDELNIPTANKTDILACLTSMDEQESYGQGKQKSMPDALRKQLTRGLSNLLEKHFIQSDINSANETIYYLPNKRD